MSMLDIASVASAASHMRRDNSTDTNPDGDLNYIPSNGLTTIAVSIFGVISFGLIYRVWRGRWRAWYMLPMTIGGLVMTFGLAMRFALRTDPQNMTKFLAEYLGVVLSPCGFIASDYAILGRLARYTDTNKHLLIRARFLTKIFVLSDVLTFIIQAVGGSLATSDTPSQANLGDNIFKVGIILQCTSFITFTTIYALWLYRVRTQSPEVWAQAASLNSDGPVSKKFRWTEDWRALTGALAVSCVGILIRSVYRTIEGIQGFSGALASNEGTFYFFDTLPLIFATTVFIIVWPGNYIDSSRFAAPVEGSEHELV